MDWEGTTAALFAALVFAALEYWPRNVLRWAALGSGFALITFFSALPSNNDLVQGDTMLGIVFVLTVGVGAFAAGVGGKWLIGALLREPKLNPNDCPMLLVWPTCLLAIAHAARCLVDWSLVPMVREDALATGMLLFYAAGGAVVGSIAGGVVGIKRRAAETRRPAA